MEVFVFEGVQIEGLHCSPNDSVDVTKKVESAVEVSVCMTTTRNHLTPCFNFKLSHNIVQLIQNPLPVKTKHQFVSNHWI